MKIPAPVLEALARHYEQSQAGKTGRGERDVAPGLEVLLEQAGAREGEAREIAERQLRDAARRGLIGLEPAHRRDPASIGRVRLAPASEQAYFDFLGEISPTQRRRDWQALFLEASEWPVEGKFAGDWQLFCRARAERAVHWERMLPFRRGEREAARTLLEWVARLLEWNEPEHFIRAASCRLCGDSKELERQRSAVELLLREATGGVLTSLGSLGILESPRHVLAAGPLRLMLEERVIDLAGLRDGASLSEADLARGRVETTAERCVTVENKTSFHQRALENRGELLIHTSYPNGAVRALIRKLPEGMEFCHWGDNDPTGFDILRELRISTGRPFESLQMAYVPDAASPLLTAGERRLLARLLEEPVMHPEKPALAAMLAAGRKGLFEQEFRRPGN